jgi:putative tricarboxylic transport membrane protein
MFITSAMILVFGGLMATRLFARILLVPPSLLMPMILCLTILGIYTLNNSVFDLYVLLIFGILGYFLEKVEVPLAPAALGLILGRMAEYNFRTSLQMSRQDFSIFFTRGVCQLLIALIVVLVVLLPFITRFVLPRLRGDRKGI